MVYIWGLVQGQWMNVNRVKGGAGSGYKSAPWQESCHRYSIRGFHAPIHCPYYTRNMGDAIAPIYNPPIHEGTAKRQSAIARALLCTRMSSRRGGSTSVRILVRDEPKQRSQRNRKSYEYAHSRQIILYRTGPKFCLPFDGTYWVPAPWHGQYQGSFWGEAPSVCWL